MSFATMVGDWEARKKKLEGGKAAPGFASSTSD